MKNIIIWGPVRSGRSFLARRIVKELSHKVGATLVVDEIYVPQGFRFKPDENNLMICLGYTEISPEDEWESRKDGVTLEYVQKRCQESHHIKAESEKLGLKYFDVSFDRERKLEEILEYIKFSI